MQRIKQHLKTGKDESNISHSRSFSSSNQTILTNQTAKTYKDVNSNTIPQTNLVFYGGTHNQQDQDLILNEQLNQQPVNPRPVCQSPTYFNQSAVQVCSRSGTSMSNNVISNLLRDDKNLMHKDAQGRPSPSVKSSANTSVLLNLDDNNLVLSKQNS